jgi:hypothetical protein
MFCVITPSKLSRQKFEFSLKVKLMGTNPSYLLKSFLLYLGMYNLTLEVIAGRARTETQAF